MITSSNSSASNCTSWNSWSTNAFNSFTLLLLLLLLLIISYRRHFYLVLLLLTLKCMSSVNIPFLYNLSIELPSVCNDNRIGIVFIALLINNFFNSSLLISEFPFASIYAARSVGGVKVFCFQLKL